MIAQEFQKKFWDLKNRLEVRSRLWANFRFVSLYLSFLFLLVLSTGCVTRPLVTDVMVPYSALRSVVASNMPIGVRKQSTNGRVLTSEYFSTTSLDLEPGDKPERGFAEVTILGMSRPYSLDIQVYLERRVGRSGQFKVYSKNPKLAQSLAERIKAVIAERREDRSVIDDFRAF